MKKTYKLVDSILKDNVDLLKKEEKMKDKKEFLRDNIKRVDWSEDVGGKLIKGIKQGIASMKETIKVIENGKDWKKVVENIIELCDELDYNAKLMSNISMEIMEDILNGKQENNKKSIK